MACAIHLSLEPGEAPVCVSNCNSSCVNDQGDERPSPMSSPSTRTINASASRVDPGGGQTTSSALCSGTFLQQQGHHLSRHVLGFAQTADASALKARSRRSFRTLFGTFQFDSPRWSIATAPGARPDPFAPGGAADRVGRPGAAVYGSQVVLSRLLWHESRCSSRTFCRLIAPRRQNRAV